MQSLDWKKVSTNPISFRKLSIINMDNDACFDLSKFLLSNLLLKFKVFFPGVNGEMFQRVIHIFSYEVGIGELLPLIKHVPLNQNDLLIQIVRYLFSLSKVLFSNFMNRRN